MLPSSALLPMPGLGRIGVADGRVESLTSISISSGRGRRRQTVSRATMSLDRAPAISDRSASLDPAWPGPLSGALEAMSSSRDDARSFR